MGKILIIGGSDCYSGAPYFSGISALRVGADLVHIVTTLAASVPIKCYSPELIVHPILPDSTHSTIASSAQQFQQSCNDIFKIIDRVHSVIIGPGLGRDATTHDVVNVLFDYIVLKSIPLIIDADGLMIFNKKPALANYSKLIITPNKVEFQRLSSAINESSPEKLSSLLGCIVIQKGKVDKIYNGSETLTVDEIGSDRRCGGQGDVLSGILGVYAYWATLTDTSLSIAAKEACIAVRKAAKLAFEKKHMGMITGDLISELNAN